MGAEDIPTVARSVFMPMQPPRRLPPGGIHDARSSNQTGGKNISRCRCQRGQLNTQN
jgi:hypothetical protein